jgi:putative phosphoribosyl transferase
MRLRDRRHAGRLLAGLLEHHRGQPGVVVLGLPRGGVPVAYEVAKALGAPLDVYLVRKLGTPGHEELAMGAIADGDVVALNRDIADCVPGDVVQQVIRREARELRRQGEAYRSGRARLDVAGRTVVLVDDGLATGASMRAAVEALRGFSPLKIVVAVPVAPEGIRRQFAEAVDEVVCVMTPEPFTAVGAGYRDFTQVEDDEVTSLLQS